MADDSYLSMLNNPYINPPPPQQQQKEENTVTKANREPVFKTAEKAGKELLDSCKELYLISETDASWQSIQKPWTSLTKGDDDELPNTLDELISIGLVDKEQINEPFKIKSLNAFFDPMMDKQDDPYQQADRYCQLYQQCKSILGNDAKVYLVGSTTILVLILGLVKENDQKALIGLQSELVQT